MLLKDQLCVLTEDALVDMVFSSNVRKCRKLRSDYVTCESSSMTDCSGLPDVGCAWTSHCMTES